MRVCVLAGLTGLLISCGPPMPTMKSCPVPATAATIANNSGGSPGSVLGRPALRVNIRVQDEHIEIPPRPAKERPCRRDAFIIDVALRGEAPGEFLPVHPIHREVLQRIEEALNAFVTGRPNYWGATGCPGALRARVSPVTSGCPECTGQAATEAFRHAMVTFHCVGTDERAELGAEAMCSVVDGLHTLARNFYGEANLPVPKLHIARECDAAGQFERNFWHYEKVTGETAALTSSSPAARVEVVDVSPGINLKTPPGYDPETGLTPVHGPLHANAVMQLINDYAPGAAIGLRQGLSSPEGGPVAGVALALERILNDSKNPRDKPLVVNMSLGFAPEYRDAAGLTGTIPPVPAWGAGHEGGCRTTEGPIGESMLSQLSRASKRPLTLVVAAAGNRLEGGPENDVFYPAAWDDLTLSVGAYGPNWIKRASGEGDPLELKRKADVWAPGLGIRLDLEKVEHHGHWILGGSSLATAIVSGLAARMLAGASATPSGGWQKEFREKWSVDTPGLGHRAIDRAKVADATTCADEWCTGPGVNQAPDPPRVCKPGNKGENAPNPAPTSFGRSNYAMGSTGPQPNHGCLDCFVRPSGTNALTWIQFSSAARAEIEGNVYLIASGQWKRLTPPTSDWSTQGAKWFTVKLGANAWSKNYKLYYRRRNIWGMSTTYYDPLPKVWFP